VLLEGPWERLGLATGRVGKCVEMVRALLINKFMQLATLVALILSCEQLTWQGELGKGEDAKVQVILVRKRA
jgi:hypothetical protein